MRTLRHLMTLGTVAIMVSASAQQLRTPDPSPSSKLTQSVGLTEITVEYSRPSAKGRKLFGDLVPFGELWRTGANSATKITFSKDVVVGGKDVKAGSYAILTLPGEKEWTLNLYTYENSNFGTYLQKEAAASVKAPSYMMPEGATVETFLIDINSITNSSASLDLVWGNTYVGFPINVKTDEEVMKQINGLEASMKATQAQNYYSAAAYLLSEKKELEKALNYVNQAVAALPEAFWMSRTQSQILAELGRYQEAVNAAQASMAAAKAANNGQYVKFNEDAIAEWTPKIQPAAKKKK
jgi:hypothetical protein